MRFKPIEDLFNAISGIKSIPELMQTVGELHKVGVDALFSSFSMTDQKCSSVYAFYLAQGGLSLPDKDYYLKDSFAQIRQDFKSHVTKMFKLQGATHEQAEMWAGVVLDIETELAKASRSRVELRDPEKNYNKVNATDLAQKYSSLSLGEYINRSGVPKLNYAIVMQPEFLDSLGVQLKSHSIDEWKIYLKWHTLSTFAHYLHKEVSDEDFDFFGNKLTGKLKPEERWKDSIKLVDGKIGEALGKLYVDRHFTPDAKNKANGLVKDLLEVVEERLKNVPWMSEETKKKALDKLSKFTVKIGYPDKFRDYSGLSIDPSDLVGNIRRANEFEWNRTIKRVGQPVDRAEWFMTAPTVNAYYSPTENEIVFPAGILQPPFFDPKMDSAVNYGAIGAVIGHEITHGFDDQGRQYDGDGNLHDWWTKQDLTEFKLRTDPIVKEYGAQEVLPGKSINGELTLGENIADLGGVSIAYEALQRKLARDQSERRIVDGLTPEQRFFIAYAQVWKESIREVESVKRLVTDPHSPGKIRAKLPAENHPDFDLAFPPKDGSITPRKDKVGVW